MRSKKLLLTFLLVLASLFLVAGANAATLVAHQEGGTVAGADPDYEWWYGCSPTSAGMMMGFYDLNGYEGLNYNNLVPGHVELSNFGNSDAKANQVIASDGHIADFWTGYGNSGDDPNPGTTRQFDSLADFMGTSQDILGNSDGGTTFWNYTDGSRLYGDEIYSAGSYYYERSGMYGIWEYFTYAGYTADKHNIFNQYIDALGLTFGFTWDDYMAEIDAGRVVMIHVSGHSMFGYGYDADTMEVLLHDTWYEGEQRMAWGDAYYGLQHYGVTAFTPAGGVVPEPSTMILLGIGLLGTAAIIRRKKVV